MRFLLKAVFFWMVAYVLFVFFMQIIPPVEEDEEEDPAEEARRERLENVPWRAFEAESIINMQVEMMRAREILANQEVEEVEEAFQPDAA
jgi:hypothetical protein